MFGNPEVTERSAIVQAAEKTITEFDRWQNAVDRTKSAIGTTTACA